MQHPVQRVQGGPLTRHPTDRLPAHASISVCAPRWAPHPCGRVSSRDLGRTGRRLQTAEPYSSASAAAGPLLPREPGGLGWAAPGECSCG